MFLRDLRRRALGPSLGLALLWAAGAGCQCDEPAAPKGEVAAKFDAGPLVGRWIVDVEAALEDPQMTGELEAQAKPFAHQAIGHMLKDTAIVFQADGGVMTNLMGREKRGTFTVSAVEGSRYTVQVEAQSTQSGADKDTIWAVVEGDRLSIESGNGQMIKLVRHGSDLAKAQRFAKRGRKAQEAAEAQEQEQDAQDAQNAQDAGAAE